MTDQEPPMPGQPLPDDVPDGVTVATDLDDVIARINAAAFTIENSTECPHCKGEVPLSDDHGRRTVHSVLGGFGADGDAEGTISQVRAAWADPTAIVGWIDTGSYGHDLYVRTVREDREPWNPPHREYMFEVPAPERVTS